MESTVTQFENPLRVSACGAQPDDDPLASAAALAAAAAEATGRRALPAGSVHAFSLSAPAVPALLVVESQVDPLAVATRELCAATSALAVAHPTSPTATAATGSLSAAAVAAGGNGLTVEIPPPAEGLPPVVTPLSPPHAAIMPADTTAGAGGPTQVPASGTALPLGPAGEDVAPPDSIVTRCVAEPVAGPSGCTDEGAGGCGCWGAFAGSACTDEPLAVAPLPPLPLPAAADEEEGIGAASGGAPGRTLMRGAGAPASATFDGSASSASLPPLQRASSTGRLAPFATLPPLMSGRGPVAMAAAAAEQARARVPTPSRALPLAQALACAQRGAWLVYTDLEHASAATLAGITEFLRVLRHLAPPPATPAALLDPATAVAVAVSAYCDGTAPSVEATSLLGTSSGVDPGLSVAAAAGITSVSPNFRLVLCMGAGNAETGTPAPAALPAAAQPASAFLLWALRDGCAAGYVTNEEEVALVGRRYAEALAPALAAAAVEGALAAAGVGPMNAQQALSPLALFSAMPSSGGPLGAAASGAQLTSVQRAKTSHPHNTVHLPLAKCRSWDPGEGGRGTRGEGGGGVIWWRDERAESQREKRASRREQALRLTGRVSSGLFSRRLCAARLPPPRLTPPSALPSSPLPAGPTHCHVPARVLGCSHHRLPLSTWGPARRSWGQMNRRPTRPPAWRSRLRGRGVESLLPRHGVARARGR